MADFDMKKLTETIKKHEKENQGWFANARDTVKQKTFEAALDARKLEKHCDPVVKKMVEHMMEDQRAEAGETALVVINSFDYEKDDIEEDMTRRKIVTEVFEIDRLRSEDRNDYLNCFNEMYKTRQLPMIFLKDQYIGDYQALRAHWEANKIV